MTISWATQDKWATVWDKEKELCYSKIVTNTTVSLETTNLMAKAPTAVMIIIILVNLEITSDMAQVT